MEEMVYKCLLGHFFVFALTRFRLGLASAGHVAHMFQVENLVEKKVYKRLAGTRFLLSFGRSENVFS